MPSSGVVDTAGMMIVSTCVLHVSMMPMILSRSPTWRRKLSWPQAAQAVSSGVVRFCTLPLRPTPQPVVRALTSLCTRPVRPVTPQAVAPWMSFLLTGRQRLLYAAVLLEDHGKSRVALKCNINATSVRIVLGVKKLARPQAITTLIRRSNKTDEFDESNKTNAYDDNNKTNEFDNSNKTNESRRTNSTIVTGRTNGRTSSKIVTRRTHSTMVKSYLG